MGAHIVIGVDVSPRKIYGEVTSIFDVIMQSLQIMETQIIKPTEFRTDILIRPDVERFKPRAFTNLDQIIMEGARATKAMLPKIREVIAEFGKWNKFDYKIVKLEKDKVKVILGDEMME